jgi:hypothetical protein
MKKMLGFWGSLFFAIMISFVPVTVLGQTWDVAQQFDTSNNPASSSPWSYGYSSELAGAFNLLTVPDNTTKSDLALTTAIIS